MGGERDTRAHRARQWARVERQRAPVGAREARGGGSDVAPVMLAAREVPTAKRQAPARGAP